MTKPFRAVEWMREVRAQIDAEDASLSWEERKKKTWAILEGNPLWMKLKPRVVEAPIVAKAAK